MKAVSACLLLSLLQFVTLPIHALDAQKVARAKYDELAAKVNRGALNIDWQALRLAASDASPPARVPASHRPACP